VTFFIYRIRHSKTRLSRNVYGPSFSVRDFLVLHFESTFLFIPSYVMWLSKTNAAVKDRRKTETAGASLVHDRVHGAWAQLPLVPEGAVPPTFGPLSYLSKFQQLQIAKQCRALAYVLLACSDGH